MRRRIVLAALGTAMAGVAPPISFAQTTKRIGVLMAVAETDPDVRAGLTPVTLKLRPPKSQPASKHDGQDLHSTETGGGWLFAFRSLETRGSSGEYLLRAAHPQLAVRKAPFSPPLDDHGQPLGLPPVETRRPSKFIVPVPQARRRAARAQGALPLEIYSDSAIISEIRG